jgi:hypothetical protein
MDVGGRLPVVPCAARPVGSARMAIGLLIARHRGSHSVACRDAWRHRSPNETLWISVGLGLSPTAP